MFHTNHLFRVGRALAILLVAAGCLGCAPVGVSGDAAGAVPSDRPVPPKIGNLAWDFRLPTLQEGESIQLSDLRGKKVVLNFWATWCGPCRSEIPAMVEMYDKMRGQDFEILAVNVRESRQKVQPFADELQINFPVLLDVDGKVSRDYYVRGIPTTLLIDQEGIIRIVHVGILNEKTLRDYIRHMTE